MVLNIPTERQWIANHYATASGNWDLFVPFVEKALSRLKDEASARFSYIIPNKVLGSDYAKTLWAHIDSDYQLEEIVDVSREKVFSDADVYPIILVVRKGGDVDTDARRVIVTRSLDPLVQEPGAFMPGYTANWAEYLAKDRKLLAALSKFDRLGQSLEVYSAATVNEAYLVADKLVDSRYPAPKQLKFINTGTIDRYTTTWGKYRTQYIKKAYDAPVIAQDTAPQKPWLHHPRIIIAGMATVIEAFPDPRMKYFAGKSTVLVTTDGIDELFYATAVLNSPVMTAFFKEMYNSEAMAGGYINVKPGGIRDLPYVAYDSSLPAHKKIVAASHDLTEAYAALSSFSDTSNSFLRDEYGVAPGKTGDLIGAGFTKVRKKIKGLSVKAAAQLHEWFTAKESEHQKLTDVIIEKERLVSHLVAGVFGVRKLMMSYEREM